MIELERGTSFAGYVIERVLGTGGMGTVYLARHPHLPKGEALKLLRPELCRDPVFAGRFHREADTLAGLSHPNILPVHDRGSENGQLWISMPFVDGRDAAAAVRAHPDGLQPGFAVHVIGQIGSALDYAHRGKLLHRDVKPANILLTAAPDRGEPEWAFLTDFGIATSVDEAGRFTAAGDVVATFQYASPEQIDGKALDHRSDIYSLGCVLYELLTGRPPYPGASLATAIEAHLHAPPPRPTAVRPGLPAAFDEVIATAMAKSPPARYQSCRALAQQAHRALSSAPALPTPVTLQAGSLQDGGPRADLTHARGIERPFRGAGPDTQPRPSRSEELAAGVSLVKSAPRRNSSAVPVPESTPPPTSAPPSAPTTTAAPPPSPSPSRPAPTSPPAPPQGGPMATRSRPNRRRHGLIGGAVAVVVVGLVVVGIAAFGGVIAGMAPGSARPVPAQGTVATWGDGADGQLGSATDLIGSPEPVPVAGLTGAVGLTGGWTNGYALMADGTVQGWGLGDEHQLGAVPDPVVRNAPAPIDGLTGVREVSGGSGTGFALLTDGTVMTWGRGDQGQLGNGTTPSAGADPAPVSGLNGVTAVSGGYTNGYALLTDGTVMAWGQGDHGQLGNGTSANSSLPVPVTGLTRVTAIAGGSGTGYALLDDGTVMAWGQGDQGQLGNGAMSDSTTPVRVVGLTDIASISGGSGNGYALRADGTVVAWGNGDLGLLGDGSTFDSAIPVPVAGLAGVDSISGRSENAYALLRDGSVVAWGKGDKGQLGNGTTSDSAGPVPVAGLAGVTAIAGGSGTGFALR